MNIVSQFMKRDETVEADGPLTDEELAEIKRERHRHAPKHGPAKVRWMTSGQQRRAQARYQAAQTRKANRRYRKAWIANEAAFQTLRSQLALLVERPESALSTGVRRTLIERYGSVEQAVEHFTALRDERIERSQVRGS